MRKATREGISYPGDGGHAAGLDPELKAINTEANLEASEELSARLREIRRRAEEIVTSVGGASPDETENLREEFFCLCDQAAEI